MSATPGYASTPKTGGGRLTTGDTSRTSPATFVTIFTPGASGGRCERINVAPNATTVQSVIRIFRYDGSVMHLLFEIQVEVLTASGSTKLKDYVFSASKFPQYFPIMLGASETLRASVNDTQTGIDVSAEGGAF